MNGELIVAPKEGIVISHDEIELIKEIVEGKSSKEIAAGRGLSPKTIELRKSNLLRRTGCKNTIQLIATCFRKKLIE